MNIESVEGKDYEKENLELLGEVENMMFEYIRRGIKEHRVLQERQPKVQN